MDGPYNADIKVPSVFPSHVVIVQPPRLQTKLADTETVYDGAATSKDLTAFIKDRFMGIVGHRTMDNMAFFDAKRPLLVVYFEVDYDKNPKRTKPVSYTHLTLPTIYSV